MKSERRRLPHTFTKAGDLARFAKVVWADDQPIEPLLLVVGLDTEGRLHNLAVNNEHTSQMMLAVDEMLTRRRWARGISPRPHRNPYRGGDRT